MIIRLQFIGILFLLFFINPVHAQFRQQQKSGTITVQVMCNCQLITRGEHQPLHLVSCGQLQQDRKPVKINSNCMWQLRVVSNKRNYPYHERRTGSYAEPDRKRGKRDHNSCNMPDDARVIYYFRNIRGDGELLNPNEIYELGEMPQNLPEGKGNLEFDVVFELVTNKKKHLPPWVYHTWVSFYVLPNE